MKKIMMTVVVMGLAVSVAHAAGSVQVKVAFEGAAPVRTNLPGRSAFPACGGDMLDESLIVNNGAVQNVAVVVSSPTLKAAAPAELTVDQKKCMYIPRISVANSNGSIKFKILNSDNTMHNVHCKKPDKTTAFNQVMINDKVPPLQKQVDGLQPGQIVAFKCDIHPWMSGFVVNGSSPYNGVTTADGTLNIANVPAGDYTVTLWHEKLGQKVVPVKVEEGKAAQVAVKNTEFQKTGYSIREVTLASAEVSCH